MEKKVVLLTGASRGIGSGILDALLKMENYVVIATATSAKGLESIDRKIQDVGAEGMAIKWQADDRDGTDQMLDKIKEAYRTYPDILINNAGITRDNLMLRIKDEQWDDVIETNLTAVFRLSRKCIQSMLRKRWGRVINMSSVVGAIGNPGQSNYAAAKAGLIGMSKALAAEVANRNITVNCICPGYIETDMLDFLTEAQKEEMLEKIPMKRLGKISEIAGAVCYLLSEESAYMTGSCLHLNGGLVML